MPLIHTYVTSEGDTLVEHFTYKDNTNKVEQCVTTKNGYVVDGYRLEYDNAYRVVKRKKVYVSSTALPVGITDDIWVMLDTCKYDSVTSKLIEVYDCQSNITTTYLWSYGGQYPIAKIVNATLNEVETKIGTNQIKALRDSYTPNMTIVNNLRNLLPNASVCTMTYAPFVGMTSYTDEKGYTLYYTYNDVGQVQEIYEIVGDAVHVLRHFDYQIINQ
jgi:hypothetical protein